MADEIKNKNQGTDITPTVPTKVIYGQPWMVGSDIVQEQITMTLGNPVTSETKNVIVIKDIWNDLLTGTDIKTNGKGFFYWEIKVTSLDSEDVMIKFECPKPKDGMWGELADGTTEWAKYWNKKYEEVKARDYKIQRDEWTLPGTKRINFTTGEQEETEDVTYQNPDLGDLQNLLNILY